MGRIHVAAGLAAAFFAALVIFQLISTLHYPGDPPRLYINSGKPTMYGGMDESFLLGVGKADITGYAKTLQESPTYAYIDV